MKNIIPFRIAALALLAVTFTAVASFAAKATVPGKITLPYPTLTNLAVEWRIEGDDNLDAVCLTSYRTAGETAWHEAMPLRRVPAGQSTGTHPIFRWDNKLSGSILDLKPGTSYEIRLSLRDPDGGRKDTVVAVSTRPVPRPAADARVIKAGPDDYRKLLATLKPGDILELGPGWYEEMKAEVSGEPGRPIVIRSDRSYPGINATFTGVNLEGCRHVILEGVTVMGPVELRWSDNVTVRHCTVNSNRGIAATDRPGASNAYIADNVVTSYMPWDSLALGCCVNEKSVSCVGEGIEITGPGNVIAFNRVAGYRDCISTMEDLWTYDQRCIDIYNNDISRGDDDAIEADFTEGNTRIMRNRITNCFISLSSQPGLGGPSYFIRNVMYNVINTPFKLARGSKGDVVLHNTVVKVGDGFMVGHNPSLVKFRNNLTIGGRGGADWARYGTGGGLAVSFPRADSTMDMDYCGFGVDGMPFRGDIGGTRFASLDELLKKTPVRHAVQVDMSVFASGAEFPVPVFPERLPVDLRLAPGSAAVDAGEVIPNVNENYTGKAPDLGAYELGQELPHYGPRPPGVDEETMWNELHGK
jgi:hypothetical protein